MLLPVFRDSPCIDYWSQRTFMLCLVQSGAKVSFWETQLSVQILEPLSSSLNTLGSWAADVTIRVEILPVTHRHLLLPQTDNHTEEGTHVFFCVLWWDFCFSLNCCKNYKRAWNLNRCTLDWEKTHNTYFTLCTLGWPTLDCSRSDQSDHSSTYEIKQGRITEETLITRSVLTEFQKMFLQHPLVHIIHSILPLQASQLRGISRGIVTQCQPALTLAQRQKKTDSSSPAMRLEGLFVVTRTAISA